MDEDDDDDDEEEEEEDDDDDDEDFVEIVEETVVSFGAGGNGKGNKCPGLWADISMAGFEDKGAE